MEKKFLRIKLNYFLLIVVILFLAGLVSFLVSQIFKEITRASPDILSGNCPDCIICEEEPPPPPPPECTTDVECPADIDWFDAGTIKCCESDKVYDCQIEEYWDYYCDGGECKYNVLKQATSKVNGVDCPAEFCFSGTYYLYWDCSVFDCQYEELPCNGASGWRNIEDLGPCCDGENIARCWKQEWYDYACSGNTCEGKASGKTQEVKLNPTPCPGSGWRDVGPVYLCCDGDNLCQSCQYREERNYFCSEDRCSPNSYDVINTDIDPNNCAPCPADDFYTTRIYSCQDPTTGLCCLRCQDQEWRDYSVCVEVDGKGECPYFPNSAPTIYEICGSCEPFYGGLLPCGREFDDPATPENESEPCQLEDFFLLAKRIVDFLLGRLIPAVFVLILVIGGALFVLTGGHPKVTQTGKSIIKAAVIGLLIVLLAWLIINGILAALGATIDWSPL